MTDAVSLPKACASIVFLVNMPSYKNEERTSNPGVAGSNPAGRALESRYFAGKSDA
jgi:hypothetical protein